MTDLLRGDIMGGEVHMDSDESPARVATALDLPPRHWSANSWEIDRECQRKGFYHSVYAGTGIQPRSEAASKAPELTFGGAYHAALAELRWGAGIDPALYQLHKELEAMPEDQLKLWKWVGEGLLRSWERVAWPKWQSDYCVIGAPVELKLADPATGLVAIVDWVPESATDGHIYVEDKTASSVDAEWLAQWDLKAQLMSGPHCLKVAKGIEVSYSIVQAHIKGRWVKQAEGPKAHCGLFSNGWYRGRGFDGLPIEWSATRPSAWKGWEKALASDVYPSPEVMVESLAERQSAKLEELFPQTLPIQAHPSHIARWLRQAHAQESVKRAAAQASAEKRLSFEDLDALFPMNTSACRPRWHGGVGCPFEPLCFNSSVEADPIGSGIYVAREDQWQELLK